MDTSTVLLERILRINGLNGLKEFQALIDLWVEENKYDPQWDGAVRDWGRNSTTVLKVVQTVDQTRVSVPEQVFLDMGYQGNEALIRARITYYHQVGYYSLGLRQLPKERLALGPYYIKVLIGH